jgi:hypothetical protein
LVGFDRKCVLVAEIVKGLGRVRKNAGVSRHQIIFSGNMRPIFIRARKISLGICCNSLIMVRNHDIGRYG